RLPAQPGEVDLVRGGLALDRRRRVRGDDPELGLRGGQRPLDLEPRLDESRLREGTKRYLVAEGLDERQEERRLRRASVVSRAVGDGLQRVPPRLWMDYDAFGTRPSPARACSAVTLIAWGGRWGLPSYTRLSIG